MRIVSYNVNGIRAAMRKDLLKWMQQAQPNVLCVQETKAQKDQVDTDELETLGYRHYWFSAEKKGYSGVSIFSNHEPKHVEYGTGIDYMDHEGRVIRLDFDKFSVISVYVPSATNMDRLGFKMQFCEDFLEYIKKLKKELPGLIVSGDFNICHQAIDIHDPVRNAKVSGFLPEEREWLSRFMHECGLIDTFRYFVKEPHNYSWWTYRANARANNKGWRIDYNFATENLEPQLKRAAMLKEAEHSDHCPVLLDLEPF